MAYPPPSRCLRDPAAAPRPRVPATTHRRERGPAMPPTVLGSLGDAAGGENLVGRPPTSGFLGAGEAVQQFDAGSRFEGLRSVATSTRVRLFPFPRRLPRATVLVRSGSGGCCGRG